MDDFRTATALSDARSTDEIVASLCRSGIDDDERSLLLGVLHARGTRSEFDAGAELCANKASRDRVLGADILAQLGWGDPTFVEESVDILLALLADREPAVVGAAGVALGHRHSPRAIAPVLPLIAHASPEVRFGAVFALSRHDDPAAIGGLIKLSTDVDLDVRNWATFGLAQMTTLDTRELRDALVTRLDDANPEIRGEALIGLASRRDERVLIPLQRELSGQFLGSWAVEAAKKLKHPSLSSLLMGMKNRLSPDDAKAFGCEVDSAVEACQGTNRQPHVPDKGSN